MKRYYQVAGFILAGGASSRMGRDKGLLDFGGVPLILHTARLLESLVAEVTVVGSPQRYAALGLHAIADENDEQTRGGPNRPSRGPLAGIAAALAATHSRWNVIVACDLPYLSKEWLDWLISRALRSRREAVVPRTERGIEPLAAHLPAANAARPSPPRWLAACEKSPTSSRSFASILCTRVSGAGSIRAAWF